MKSSRARLNSYYLQDSEREERNQVLVAGFTCGEVENQCRGGHHLTRIFDVIAN